MPTETVVTGLAINGTQICFLSVDDLSEFTYVDINGNIMCGSPDHFEEFVVPGLEIFRLRCLIAPHPGELDIIVPLLGVDESPTDTFKPNATGPSSFTTLVRRKSSTNVTHTYSSCKINQATFRSQTGNHPLTCELDIMGLTYSEGSTFSPATISRQAHYAHHDGGLTVDTTQGTAERDCGAFAWRLNNGIKARFNSSVTADVLGFTQRACHVFIDVPYDDAHDDILTTFTTAATRHDGVDLTMAYARSTKNLIFDHDNVKCPISPPKIVRKDQDVRLQCMFEAYRDAAQNDCVFDLTQDNT